MPNPCRPRLVALVTLCFLGALALPAAPQNVMVLGDSLSEEYAFEIPFSAPASNPLEANIANWVEILAVARAGEISFGYYTGQLASYTDYRNGGHAFNWAVPGFRTTDLVELLNPPTFPSTAEQLLDAVSCPKLKIQLRDGSVAWVVVFCSGNDLSALYTELCTGVATNADLAAIRDNLATVIDFVRAQNATLKIVLVNAPDVGVTPSVKGRVPDPALRAVASAHIGELNTLLAALAADRGIAYADICSITRSIAGDTEFLIGGLPFLSSGDAENRPQYLFAKDGFHASTAAQALIANAILGAMNSRYDAGFTLLPHTEILTDVLGLEAGPPVVTAQPRCMAVIAQQPATLSVKASCASVYQWSKGGFVVPGATSATLDLPAVGPAQAGLYDCAVSGSGVTTLSTPMVLGVMPVPGQRIAGNVATRPEWQDIHHPNGAIYDQYLLTGAAGTFTADPGQIARCSYLDENESIVQVEMSGAGAITIVLDSTSVAGPTAPSLYNQSGIEYMRGKATIILAGAGATTHFTIYSVGTATNPGVTRPEVLYVGWADVAAAGIVSTDGGLGGIHQGNVSYNAALGYAGLYAPTVTRVVGQPVVVHNIAASDHALPYLYFAPGGQIEVKVAGGAFTQSVGDSISVGGLSHVTMSAGQDSCGRAAPAQTIQTRLVDDNGTDVTPTIVTGP